MSEALAFIREWMRRADGDELQLLLEALRVSIEATRDEAEIRVEAPQAPALLPGPARRCPDQPCGLGSSAAAGERQAVAGGLRPHEGRDATPPMGAAPRPITISYVC